MINRSSLEIDMQILKTSQSPVTFAILRLAVHIHDTTLKNHLDNLIENELIITENIKMKSNGHNLSNNPIYCSKRKLYRASQKSQELITLWKKIQLLYHDNLQ